MCCWHDVNVVWWLLQMFPGPYCFGVVVAAVVVVVVVSRPLFSAVVYQWDETKGTQVYWNCTFLRIAVWCLMVKSLSTFTFLSAYHRFQHQYLFQTRHNFSPTKNAMVSSQEKMTFPKNPPMLYKKHSPKNCRHARGNADSCAPCTRVRPCSWQTRPEICCSSSGPTKKGFAMLVADLSLSSLGEVVIWWNMWELPCFTNSLANA